MDRYRPAGSGTIDEDRARLFPQHPMKVVDGEAAHVPPGHPDDRGLPPALSLGDDVHPVAAHVDEPAGRRMQGARPRHVNEMPDGPERQEPRDDQQRGADGRRPRPAAGPADAQTPSSEQRHDGGDRQSGPVAAEE